MLTLDEQMDASAKRAREDAAEKHFFDQAKADGFLPLGFSVGYRNPGHWDIMAERSPGKREAFLAANPGSQIIGGGSHERAFRIRGEAGNVVVFDERWDPYRPHPREPLRFRSVMGAMVYIMEELMQEPDV